MSRKTNTITAWWFEIVVLILISALVYAMDIGRASYYRDDWYYAYDGYVAGPSIYHEMFKSDRPARGVFFEAYYILFGPNALPYHLGIYLWRLLGGFGALWLFHILWPKQRTTNFASALIFLTYPGFLWWVAGIEYQPMVASLCLHVFSIALTLKALQTQRWIPQITLVTGAILTGWGALALVDYAIGMEVFRILCIFLLVSHSENVSPLTHRLVRTIRASLIPLIIPFGFTAWRLFVFAGDRKATDIGFQLGILLSAPFETSLLWGTRLLQSVLNVSALAWSVPLYNYFFSMNFSDQLFSLLVGALVIILFLFAVSSMRDKVANDDPGNPAPDKWQWEAIWLGFTGVLFGVLPIVTANRYIVFHAYSHYALPASLAAAILVTGIIFSFESKRARIVLVSLLIGVSALTHRAVSLNAVNEEQIIRDFWWQVYWRAPHIREGATLAVNYPSIDYGEDSDIVWGPANFMYYPEQSLGTDLVKYKLAATSMTREGVLNVIMESRRDARPSRSHTMFLNYRRVLVISQPSTAACVHVIDERWPDISIHESAQAIVMFPHSKIENVLTDQIISAPQSFVFGSEPPHDWCYYYQKGDLARQQGDWETVARLGEEAEELKLMPKDLVEWMPFLQAYAYLGDKQKVELISAQLSGDNFYIPQICGMSARMNENGYPLPSQMIELVDGLFCQPEQ